MDSYNYLLPYVLSGMALIGTYCLILAYEKQHEIEKVLTRGIKTLGTVTEMRQDASENAGEAPVVDFTTQNGSYKHFSTTYAMPSAYKVGQQVEIWYYHYKSIRLAALADDKPGNLPKTLFRWGIILCILTYPVIIGRMTALI
ncbi:MAG: DUF3592 domain-containing protein [Saprospiraceae bacterium]